jgi:hypothetical protein
VELRASRERAGVEGDDADDRCPFDVDERVLIRRLAVLVGRVRRERARCGRDAVHVVRRPSKPRVEVDCSRPLDRDCERGADWRGLARVEVDLQPVSRSAQQQPSTGRVERDCREARSGVLPKQSLSARFAVRFSRE